MADDPIVGLLTGTKATHGAERARPADPPGAADRRALADLIRLWASEGIPTPGQSRGALERWAEAWRSAVLSGGTPEGEAETVPPDEALRDAYPDRPDLARVLTAVLQRRRSEAASVTQALASVGAAFMEVVLDVREGLLEDARDDEEIGRAVAHLEAALAADDGEALKLRAEHVARMVRRKTEARRKRSAFRMRSLGLKMAQHRDALVDPETRSATDAVTGLPARHAVEAVLERERLIAQLSRTPASVAKLGFASKQSSDRNMVDRILALFAERLRAVVGPDAYLGRFSGDELIIVMPEVDEMKAADHATAWVRAVTARPLEHGGRSLKIPLYAGVAEVLPEERRDEWVFRADEAMEAAQVQTQRRAVRYGEL